MKILKKPRILKTDTGRAVTRSVLECGDLSPLLIRTFVPGMRKRRQVGALQTLARIHSALVCLLVSIAVRHAQSFSIDWFTIERKN
jgi:hypothetical protein